MSSRLKREYILEAIDKLRSRKSRPDNVRISTYVSKKYEIPRLEIKEFLNQMTVEGSVIRVEYKGSTSYRNPATFQRNRVVFPEMVDPAVRDEISCIFARLICTNPNYLDTGISAKGLYTHLDFKTRKRITKSTFRDILEEQVRVGNFVRFENGYYCLGDSNTNNEMSFEVRSKPNILKPRATSQHSSTPSISRSEESEEPEIKIKVEKPESLSKPPVKTYMKSNTVTKIRKSVDSDTPSDKKVDANENGSKNNLKESHGTRESGRKRIQKIVFDPSDLTTSYSQKKEKSSSYPSPSKNKSSAKQVPVRKVLSPAAPAADEQDVKQEVKVKDELSDSKRCLLCKFSKWKGPKIICYLCDQPAHEECVLRAEYFSHIKQVKWFCSACAVCSICMMKKPAMLVSCGLCDDYFHTKCIKLRNLKNQTKNEEWFCKKCSVFEEDVPSKKIKLEPESSEYSSNTSAYEDENSNTKTVKRMKQRSQDDEDDEDDENDIPDCSSWSCDQVYKYFLEYVLPDEANIFKDQEINGRVLLLLTRTDVVTNFKLKLGPALKIYRQVKRLQTRKNDIQLCWS